MKNYLFTLSLLSMFAGQHAAAQTRIEKCGGLTTFNGSAKVAFINLARDTEVSIRLNSNIKGILRQSQPAKPTPMRMARATP